jgi:hypothetical protein
MWRQKKMENHAPGWLWGVFAAAVFGVLLTVDILVTRRKDVTTLELGLLQFIFFATSVGLPYLFGRRSTAAEAAAAIRRDGRKAVRRIVNLGKSIQDFGGALNEASAHTSDLAINNDGMVPIVEVEYAFRALRSHLDGQIRTVSDAIEDWRDIVPEEVESLEQKATIVEGHDA